MSRKKSRGTGEYQIGKRVKARKTLLRVLADQKWHQYSEIKQVTLLSSPTLSNHLKQLQKLKVLDKNIDTKSGKYPYPVYYRLKAPVAMKYIITEEFWEALNKDVFEKNRNPMEALDLISEVFRALLIDSIKLLKKEPLESTELFLEFFVWEPYRDLTWKFVQAIRRMIDHDQIDIDQLIKDEVKKLGSKSGFKGE